MWRQRWLNYSNKPAINMTIAVNALVTMKTMTNNHILPCGRALASHRLATEGKKWTEKLICLAGVKLRLCIFTANVVSVLLRRLLFLVFLFLLLVFLFSLAHRKCSSPKWKRSSTANRILKNCYSSRYMAKVDTASPSENMFCYGIFCQRSHKPWNGT